MISFPNSKINLGLYVHAKRDDGYHDLETIFFPIPFTDILEFVSSDSLKLSITGIPVVGDSSGNLCLKAYHLLKQLHPELAPIHIHLHKVIPLGAGLGGGSADGAFMLSMLNNFYELGHSTDELMKFALQLGSDCPFFIINKPCHALGRGEILEPLPILLSGWWFAIIYPGIHVSTAEAFENIRPGQNSIDLKNKISEPVECWKEWLRNDFEPGVIQRYPIIGQIKEQLYKAGAEFASMSGSGSAVYAFFRQKPTLNFPEEFLVRTLELK
jgi:4-diphosphocytidyl-2-C-methyl-D-erythritol kinase